ncbi:hypothetical protein SCRM01_097c [Synechococcus phage S-CRM01]|uniref:hypothetical protein n=1 Tax=Synechococcus phage S-CRM01 TaxID=1026955 RepID=UPI000209E39D|nr:hypothetical protein SCRM01_097c [Synechococcus phage S-CRM01]AEC53043.1 hypothetical protein SCRM01_097c [Synechococcus phage S-CRM01]
MINDKKFLFEIGDVLTYEKWIAEQSVKNPRTDILKIHPDFISDNVIKLSRQFVPIGSVKFIGNYMSHMNIPVPEPIDYPYQLEKYLGRKVRLDYAFNAKPTDYIKPRGTKEFTCDVKSEVEKTRDLTIEMVWISEPISINQEWRLYILNGELVGWSRYDDNEGDDIQPDFSVVSDMIKDYKNNAPISYTLDLGISDEKTILIEVNDMWGTGFYPWGTMTGEKYLECIQARWFQISGWDESMKFCN